MEDEARLAGRRSDGRTRMDSGGRALEWNYLTLDDLDTYLGRSDSLGLRVPASCWGRWAILHLPGMLPASARLPDMLPTSAHLPFLCLRAPAQPACLPI